MLATTTTYSHVPGLIVTGVVIGSMAIYSIRVAIVNFGRRAGKD